MPCTPTTDGSWRQIRRYVLGDTPGVEIHEVSRGNELTIWTLNLEPVLRFYVCCCTVRRLQNLPPPPLQEMVKDAAPNIPPYLPGPNSSASAPSKHSEADRPAVTTAGSVEVETPDSEGLPGMSFYSNSQDEDENAAAPYPQLDPPGMRRSVIDVSETPEFSLLPTAPSVAPPPWHRVAAAPASEPPMPIPAPLRPASPEPIAPGVDFGMESAMSAGSAGGPLAGGPLDSQSVSDDAPPLEIRSIADKLAAFVSRNGPIFEATVMERERRNPKFSFLLPWSPHNPYYRRKLAELGYKGSSDSSGMIQPASSDPGGGLLSSATPPEASIPHVGILFPTLLAAPTAGKPPSSKWGPKPSAPPPEAIIPSNALADAGITPSAAHGAQPAVAVAAIKANPRFHSAVTPELITVRSDAGATTHASSLIPPALTTISSAEIPSVDPKPPPTAEDPRGSPSAEAGEAVVSTSTTQGAEGDARKETLGGVTEVVAALSEADVKSQRRERARALLLQRQSEVRGRKEATIKAAVSEHRQALLLDSEGDDTSQNPTGLTGGEGSLFQIPRAVGLLRQDCETVENPVVASRPGLSFPSTSIPHVKLNAGPQPCSVSLDALKGISLSVSGASTSSTELPQADVVPTLSASLASFPGHEIGAKAVLDTPALNGKRESTGGSGTNARKRVEREEDENERKKKGKKHHRRSSRKEDEEGSRHRRRSCSRDRRDSDRRRGHRHHRRRSRSRSPSSRSPSDSSRSASEDAPSRRRRDENVGAPTIQPGQSGASANRGVNPAAQKQDSGDVDLRTKVRLMLLGLK